MRLLNDAASSADRLTALLHDTLEDGRKLIAAFYGVPESSVDVFLGGAFLKAKGYSPYVVRGVMLDTRIDHSYMHHATGELVEGPYSDYVGNIIASNHLGAILTKLADNQHNTDEARTARMTPEAQIIAHARAQSHYYPSMTALRAKLLEMGITA